jgi:pilus assembly protein FimV
LVVDSPLDSVTIPLEAEVDKEARSTAVEVERLASVLSVVDSPLDKDTIPLEVEVDKEVRSTFVVDRPLEAEVDKDARLTAVEVDRAVDSEARPLEVEVDKEYSCAPLTASVESALTSPAARLCKATVPLPEPATR